MSVFGLAGTAEPLPLTVLFSNPDGTPCELPCLFGVRPEKTRFDDALAILQSHPMLGTPRTFSQRYNTPHVVAISFTGAWTGKANFQGGELWIVVYQNEGGFVSSAEVTIEPSCVKQAQLSLGD